MIYKLPFVTFFILLNTVQVFAQINPVSTAKPAVANTATTPHKVQGTVKAVSRPNILDFEAEIIEGEKKRPELFLDITAGDGRVGSGLYMRPNFDDFFLVDKSHRSQFKKAK